MPEDIKLHWQILRDSLLDAEHDIACGQMMSADALTYGGKVFVFFSTKGGRAGLGARVGRDINPNDFELEDWQYLAPFKSKPPMKDWIVAGKTDIARWERIAKFSLNLAKQRKG